jgi:hypothetical protein
MNPLFNHIYLFWVDNVVVVVGGGGGGDDNDDSFPELKILSYLVLRSHTI